HIVYFFFSSRRRHTRFSRDWSSDVCSSDLPFPFFQNRALTLAVKMLHPEGKVMKGLIPIPAQLDRFIRLPTDPEDQRIIRFMRRSEERRVGKECRARGMPAEYEHTTDRVVT